MKVKNEYAAKKLQKEKQIKKKKSTELSIIKEDINDSDIDFAKE